MEVRAGWPVRPARPVGGVGPVAPAGPAGRAGGAGGHGTAGTAGGAGTAGAADKAPVPRPSVDEERRFQVFDGEGQFVGVFASWDAAHAWGHRRATEPRTRLPLRIEDRLDRRTWTIGPGRCQLTVRLRQPEREPPLAAWVQRAAAGAPPPTPAGGASR